MLKRKNYFALGAVILVTVVVLSLPSRAVSRLKLAVGSLFLPLFGAVSATKQLPDRAADTFLPRSELIKEIQTLRRENEEFRVRQQQADALARENEQLRALVGWQQQQPWKLKLARIVLRDPANWWLTVQIDLGSRDGLTNNLPVLTSDGLVGRVAAVGYARSQVVLIGDPRCRVSARVVDPARDLGVIGPAGPLDHSLVEMTYLPGNANLRPGQEVVTSGEGGIFPAGIPVGQIVDSSQAEYGLYSDARVKLSANLGALDQVWVLLNPRFN